jgi:hypothetical protein
MLGKRQNALLKPAIDNVLPLAHYLQQHWKDSGKHDLAFGTYR